MKHHEIRELVNDLTKIAQDYGQTQQLRDRISRCVLEALYTKPTSPDKRHCLAVQFSCEMVCPCGNVWDMNDSNPPECKWRTR